MLTLRVVVAGMVLACAPIAARAAEDFQARFFGPRPAHAKSYACFVRVYDPAHLAGHPRQNVTTMKLLAVHDPDMQGRAIDSRLRVTFRSVKGALQTGGSCGAAEGERVHCAVACDGGSIDVTLESGGTVLVAIPYGAQLYDPKAPDLEDTNVKGKFGADDKVFRLARVRPTDCLALAADDEERAALRGRRP